MLACCTTSGRLSDDPDRAGSSQPGSSYVDWRIARPGACARYSPGCGPTRLYLSGLPSKLPSSQLRNDDRGLRHVEANARACGGAGPRGRARARRHGELASGRTGAVSFPVSFSYVRRGPPGHWLPRQPWSQTSLTHDEHTATDLESVLGHLLKGEWWAGGLEETRSGTSGPSARWTGWDHNQGCQIGSERLIMPDMCLDWRAVWRRPRSGCCRKVPW